MAKRQAAKSSGGGRNPDRPNGKAWSKNSPKYAALSHPGHNKTGRTKPSGNTVKGHSVKKLSSVHAYYVVSRDTQLRKALRHARKAQAYVPTTGVSLSLAGL